MSSISREVTYKIRPPSTPNRLAWLYRLAQPVQSMAIVGNLIGISRCGRWIRSLQDWRAFQNSNTASGSIARLVARTEACCPAPTHPRHTSLHHMPIWAYQHIPICLYLQPPDKTKKNYTLSPSVNVCSWHGLRLAVRRHTARCLTYGAHTTHQGPLRTVTSVSRLVMAMVEECLYHTYSHLQRGLFCLST